MKILINVKVYSVADYVFGDLSKSSLRDLDLDVTMIETVCDADLVGYAASVHVVVRPICLLFRKVLSSTQYLALLETISYTVRQSLERTENWFHATDYEDFQICVETKLIKK